MHANVIDLKKPASLLFANYRLCLNGPSEMPLHSHVSKHPWMIRLITSGFSWHHLVLWPHFKLKAMKRL